MNYYKAILQYDGRDRVGFQCQEGRLSIQGDLNHSLQQILQGSITTRAASRTDKGVHAIGQVVKISVEDPLLLDLERLNSSLPSHIKCLAIDRCAAEFIPSIDQFNKEYRYLFTDSPAVSDRSHPYIAQAPLAQNIGHLKTCAEMLTGINDFRNFWSIGGIANTTLREINHCDLTLIDPRDFFKDTLFSSGQVNSCWQFRIVGKGFLKHMVRHLVGALWMVGDGRLSVKGFSVFLHGELKKQRPWKKADPHGLYLLKVNYEPD